MKEIIYFSKIFYISSKIRQFKQTIYTIQHNS